MLAVICVRENRKAYFKAKMKVVFWTEFMMVVLPFLINLILCLVSFKHIYSYYPSPYGGIENTDITVYSDPTFARGTTVPFVWIFKKCPVLYVVLFLLFLGCFVGALGLFLLALSFWLPRVKILLFLPVFGLTKLGSVLSGWSYQRYLENHQYLYINFNLWHYVSPISYDGKVYGIFLLGVLFLCGFIFVSYRMICRKEYTDA
jgi:ABC-type amino acid transport system permease subunit